MIVPRKSLKRRTFLKGAGAAIALPMLDAMVPTFARAGEAAKPPLRLGFAYVPNGATMEAWTPSKAGADFEFSRTLKPFEPYRKDLVVLTGLGHEKPQGRTPGTAQESAPGGHATAGSLYLTGVKPKKTIGYDVQSGISIDQVVAQAIGKESRLPSLELSCDDTRTVGNCDAGYSCVYSNTLCWRNPTSPLPPETNPRMVFERLFGADDAKLDAETRARKAAYRKSILDLVGERAESLNGTLGASDRRKVDEYLYGIREVEKRIQATEKTPPVDPGMDRPAGIPAQFAEHLQLMFDLQLLAWQSDLTRVTTLIIGREGSLRTYPEIGVPDSHHPLTHHRGNKEFIEKVTQINGYHAKLFARFIDKLKTTPDGDGTLLDHSLIVYGGGISDGDNHLHSNLPTVLFGHGDGQIKTGQHITYKPDTPMCNLFVSLMNCLGMPDEKFGASTGPLGGIAGA